MTLPTILVAGLGRCGSSLVMQMLSAAGIPTVGTYPDFEDEGEVRLRSDPGAWSQVAQGRAVKVLDPHLDTPPHGFDYRCIFLTRNPAEQGLSILKLLGAPSDRRSRRAMLADLRLSDAKARQAIIGLVGQYYNLPFESIITDPRGTAEHLASYLYLHRRRARIDVDDMIDAMAACVRPRDVACLPYMLEEELLRNA
ncbi:sulfotransferase family protein [Sphingobium sufflavum]|uniref:hypothetical protein n=1 Tax=Sphingobium sufflavum TaxID=1129547 RepID=UPI001F2AEDBB|nr:hypothetical protein [Sphingobium sufflavum]